MADAKKRHPKILTSASYNNVLKGADDMANWESQIDTALSIIGRSRTGTAVISAINRTARIMLIVPDPGTEINAATYQTNTAKAYPPGVRIVDDSGRTTGSTIGGGSCTIIEITPSNYSKRAGVFSSADAGLLHEMCHGLHVMTGTLQAHRSLGANFDNLDEFWAITLTNIYVSEKGYKQLRRDHHGRELLDPQYSTSQGFYAWAGGQIKEICKTAPTLCRDIAAIPADFNPVRYYYQHILRERL